MINQETRYFYVGNGAYLFGIPARDLTVRDLLIFEIDEEKLEKSGLYRKNLEPTPLKYGKKEGKHGRK